ncbi:hypothetical protein DLD82_07155 [Methanospirillum stamsii]|uniref:Uncharacterized protein n=1 Tax=Methanospirillum stamsii TaxID=1277351 RepID=A0A2V2N4F9_9EURY|nr:hypothetical protein DLD82_07155 [Methanospirillum stamsii]
MRSSILLTLGSDIATKFYPIVFNVVSQLVFLFHSSWNNIFLTLSEQKKMIHAKPVLSITPLSG